MTEQKKKLDEGLTPKVEKKKGPDKLDLLQEQMDRIEDTVNKMNLKMETVLEAERAVVEKTGLVLKGVESMKVKKKAGVF